MTRRRGVVIAIAVVLVVAVAGSIALGAFFSGVPGAPSSASPSAAASASPSPAPSAAASASPDPSSPPGQPDAASALLPVYLEPFTAEAAGAESTRVGDLMVAFVDASESGTPNVVNDDAVAQIVPATEAGASYYGVLHTLTLEPSVDAAEQVEALRTALVDAGWIVQDTSDADGQRLVALTSGSDEARSWFLVIGADLSVPGESVATIQLASPDLP